MEDRSCNWVQGVKRYYQSTGDKEFVKEIWLPITRQLKWFLNRRTERGLVKAREWEVSTNPLRYQVCEGTGLNSFVYKALADAAYLGKEIGDLEEAKNLEDAAHQLRIAINKHLWDKESGTYFSAYIDDEVAAKKIFEAQNMKITIKNGFAEPTFEAAIFALEQEVVPKNRLDSMNQYLKDKWDKPYCFMTYYYSFKQMYAKNENLTDEKILEMIRKRWKATLDYDWQTSWEHYFEEGSKVHIYGVFPAYFLSAYVLGVRVDGPVWKKEIIINPRLGDLNFANGDVVTEFGVVSVSWIKTKNKMKFQLNVPDGIKAKLILNGAVTDFLLNDKNKDLQKLDNQHYIDIEGGKWSGSFTYEIQNSKNR